MTTNLISFTSQSYVYHMSNLTNLLKQKLEGIHATLMQAHSDSARYAPSITGAEREIINRVLLSLILPPGYRVGTGTILDQHERNSGQVDIVIEQPFSISFPISSDQNRLFLAPSVCTAIEIKSNLKKQGKSAFKKAAAIKELLRAPIKKDEFVFYDEISIPTYIIGFKGPSTLKGIQKMYESPANKLNPNGILSIEGEIFYGKRPGKEGFIVATGKAASLFAFLQCVTQSLQLAGSKELRLDKFRSLIGKTKKTKN